MARARFIPRRQSDLTFTLFIDSEEAWFWTVQCHRLKADGARLSQGLGDVVRPCEPLDVLKAVEDLHRRRFLKLDHLKVLSDYGQQLLAPDYRREAEYSAARLWRESHEKLGKVLLAKGIVERISRYGGRSSN